MRGWGWDGCVCKRVCWIGVGGVLNDCGEAFEEGVKPGDCFGDGEAAGRLCLS